MKSILNEYKAIVKRNDPIIIDAHVANIVKGVSALTAAFRLVQLERCRGNREASCLRDLHADKLHEAILDNLKKLSFTTMAGSGQVHDDHPNHHYFSPEGRLVSTKRLVYIVDQHEGLQRVGWYSDSSGLHIDLEEDGSFQDYQDENEVGVTPPVFSVTEKPRSAPFVTTDQRTNKPKISLTTEETTLEPLKNDAIDKSISRPVFSYKAFVSRTWALIVLTFAVLGFILSMWMLVYVLLKICDGTLTGQQAMGLMLMIGVTGLFGSVVPWVLPPNEMSCAARHFLHPLLLSLCFSVLLVKAMQLRSLVSVGLGGHIPQVNQIVSLLFMVIVQVVITCEWYMMTKPIGFVDTLNQDEYPKCDVSRNRFLILHSYPAALLIVAFCYGVSVLKIKTNFHEGRWITAASISMLPIYAVWMLICYCAPGHFHDPTTAVAIIILALMILFIVFIPKMYTINQQMKLEDSKEIFYSQQTSINDSTLLSTSNTNSYGYSSRQRPPRNYYPSFSYATNYYIPKEPMRSTQAASFPRNQHPKWIPPNPALLKNKHHKVVHIHGTNGAKFNGTNFFGTREPTCTYEEWHNPTSVYNTTLHAEKMGKKNGHRSSKQKDFHAVHLGQHQSSSNRSSKERKRNSRSNSKSSSQSSPSYGCTVKGTSAIILTPDSIVYNDEGIWSHRYDTSPRP